MAEGEPPRYSATTAVEGGVCAVDIYTWDLDAAEGERHALAAHLSPDETARAARFAFETDRARFIVGRGRLRTILSRYVGSSPDAIRLEYETHGKPSVGAPTPAPHFNLSHSGAHAALAVSWDAEIGIDIEKVRSIDLRMAERYFSPIEIAALSALPASDQLSAFFRCWTLKEAVIKGYGTGLALDLASFDVSFPLAGSPALHRVESDRSASQNWTLTYLTAPPGFSAALAVKTDGRRLTFRNRPSAT